jgi:hypothetical protein
MTYLTRVCAAALIMMLPVCSAQTAHHAKKPDPKPEPTTPELSEYVRGELLSLSPEDGINDNLEVTFDPISKVMTVREPGGHCDQFLNALDSNTAVWDVFDPSDSVQQRDQLLRLTFVSVSGKVARTCYDKQNHVDPSLIANRVRLLFSLNKAEEIPKFQEKMAKAFKELIVLSGGAPENNLF